MIIISEAINKSSAIVSEYWPLTSFIAVNPLWDNTQHDFFSAIENFSYSDKQYDNSLSKKRVTLLSKQIGSYQFESAYEHVRNQCLSVLVQVFGEAVKLPREKQHQCEGYDAWLKINVLTEDKKKYLCLNNHIDIIACLMRKLNIDLDSSQNYFEEIFKSVYGFASLCKWMNHHPGNPWLSFNLTLTDIIVIWLWHEWQLADELNFVYENMNLNNQVDNFMEKHSYKEQLDNESDYQLKLLSQLNGYEPKTVEQAALQAIFCIDTRSELLRRHLEQEGNIQTFGYAGFFGFGFTLEEPLQSKRLQCPALLTPDAIVTVLQKQKSTVEFNNDADAAISCTKKDVFGSLNLFELLGLWHVFVYFGKSFMPKFWHKITSFNKKNLIKDKEISLKNLSLADATNAAWQMLITIGLIEGFAKTIIICGHQSISENNPYASSLDCGACGGNSGRTNAIIAAKLLNSADVREQLKNKGIVIPISTEFIAACHSTTYDKVILQSVHIPLNDLFDRACKKVRQEKIARFPMLTQLERRQFNWAELVPEYGLVNNAAMIIGPRWLTEHVNLEGRAFLHSYESTHDESGEMLEAIMLAPMIVAHWINMQYYFSTVLPDYFSAGNKAIHNIIPGIGVMEGNFSDLKIGLPEQSLRYRGKNLHRPQRLMVIIYAEHAKVKKIALENQKIHDLLHYEWLFIYSLTDNKLSKMIL